MHVSTSKAQEKQQKDSALIAKVIEYIQGITEVKSFGLTGAKTKELDKAIDENEHANASMELTLIPYMTVQNFLLKLIGTVMLFMSAFFYCNGTMSLLYSIIMIVSSYIIYASLESAGNDSALLRTIQVSVAQANAILAVEQMDIGGEDITPESFTLKAEHVDFSYGDK